MAGALTSSRGTQAVSDADLVAKAAAGDRSAFGEIYRRYVRRIFTLALRMLNTADEAEDVTQEVFLQAYKNLAGFQGRSGFYTWIYRVACNTCLQARKKSRHRREQLPLETVNDMALSQSVTGQPRGPEAEVERRVLMSRVAEALDSLPETQRLVMVLGPIQGHSYAQISEILGVSPDVVKGRLHRGRESVRRLLERDAPAHRTHPRSSRSEPLMVMRSHIA